MAIVTEPEYIDEEIGTGWFSHLLLRELFLEDYNLFFPHEKSRTVFLTL